MASESRLQHVRLPEVHVYCGGHAFPFQPGEPLLLPSEHVDALRAAGHKVEMHDPDQPPTAPPVPEHSAA